jgi:hypothetical protein
VGNKLQGFRRMAARNKPAGIRSLVYGVGKGKVRIEGLSVSRYLFVWVAPAGWQVALNQAEHERLLGRFFTVADR